MEQNWKIICVCLFWSLAIGAVWGETAPCMNTREQCISGGFSSISIINNQFLCCAPGFSMSVINSRCLCTRFSIATKCSKGPRACQHANTVSSDGQGNTLCCPDGYSINTQRVSVNGQTFSSCSCTRGSAGGSGGVQVINYGGTTFNSTAFENQLRSWQQRFQNGMRVMANGLSAMRNNMRNIFRNIFAGR